MTSPRLQATVGLLTLVLATLAVPVVIPVANKLRSVETPPPTYLPALEGPRERGRFEERRISELHYLQPGYVVIGDSMAGTRIDERRLGALAGTPIAPLLQPGSGPAFWYLALKNWVIPSRIKPRLVFIFFRDTNLTDVLFRLEPQFRWSLDLAARDREDELDAIVARAIDPLHRVHVFLARDLGVEQAREWAEPALTNWPAEVIEPSRRRRTEFQRLMNVRLGLDHMRPMPAADIAAGDGPSIDFHRDVDRSVLPLMLRDAKAAGLTICFVRVQRRPTAQRPPAQSPPLRAYVRDLQTYITSRGGVFLDDTGDPALTLDMYEDGDHFARHARARYTEHLYNRLRPHFQ